MHKIHLQYPVTIDGITYKHLEMRRPKVRDRILSEKIAGNMAQKEVNLLATLCNVKENIIEELDLADYLHLQTSLANLLPTPKDETTD